ncbi:hypothetical protein ACH3XW_2010 [Acanthocheilonema viteae]
MSFITRESNVPSRYHYGNWMKTKTSPISVISKIRNEEYIPKSEKRTAMKKDQRMLRNCVNILLISKILFLFVQQKKKTQKSFFCIRR